jgi:PIN domain nuclease of toxin-antitoxin system
MERKSIKDNFLLDTCAWLWLATDNQRITSAIQNKLSHADKLLISAISVWEIAMLATKGRIILDYPIEKWIHKFLTGAPKLNLIPLTPEIAVDSCSLSNFEHGDPADRIIIATAINKKAVMVTGDKQIISYCKKTLIPLLAI